MASKKNEESEYAPLEAATVEELTDAHVIGLPTLQVEAPSDLPEGYQLTVQVGGQPVTVAVPAGGVRAGESFQAPVLPSTKLSAEPSAPVGQWRDGLCDCFVHGGCHPHCCMACWCPSLALGQVMTRLGLDWTATPVRNSHQRTWSPFKVMALFTAVYYVIYVFVNAIVNPYIMISPDGNPPNPPTWVSALMVVRSLIGFAFGIFVLVMMIRTRAYIRQKSAIREQYCSGCDDCCLSFWCGCCTVAQMDRHTTDFRQCQAACCSETGLSQQTPFIV